MLAFYSPGRWLMALPLWLTMAPVQAQAPVIAAVTPAANAQAAVRTEPLRVRFTQPLTPAASGALHVFSSQRGGRRTRALPASARENTLTFTPSSYAFQPGETVNYTVTSAAASRTGGLARAQVGQFTAAVSCTGPGVFPNGSQVSVGRYPDGLALGDIDGDGDLDLLSAQYSSTSNAISVRFNDGAGRFSGNQSVGVGNDPKRVVLGDVDGDGDLDLLSANQGSSTVSVRLNDGSGQFSGGSDLAVDNYPTRVALGDLDGDGDLDVLATNEVSETVSVRVNDGTGTFRDAGEVATGNSPKALVLSDVDGDNDLDALVANGGPGTARVLLNSGRGTFTPGQVLSVGTGPYTLVAGDVDGDGDVDLLTGNIFGGVSLCRNNGQGTFSGSGPWSGYTDFINVQDLALGDVDGDGDLDLLTSGSAAAVGVRLNGGTAPTTVETVQVTGPGLLCPGTNGELLAASSTPPQAYRWSTGETSARITIRQAGVYAVTATFAGCQTASAEYVVDEADCGLVPAVLPTIITPNGDNLNETFALTGLPAGPWALVIYNRWGREVYRTEDYHNEWGLEAAPGIYYYQLRHRTLGTSRRGWLEVVR